MNLVKKSFDNLKSEVLKLPQVEFDTTHFFADGMYARVVKRPKGALLFGKVHKKEHFYIITKGSVVVSGRDGNKKTYFAGDVVISQPGTERVVYALEDSICMTVHRTDKRSIEEIESELVNEDTSSPFGVGNKLKDEYKKMIEGENPCLST